MDRITFKDFCPLCGYRFGGETVEKVLNQILEHNDNGTCKNNWVSFSDALADDGSGPGRGLYEPKEVVDV